MRGLSFTPPWPFALFHCGKNIENRQGWDTPAYTACREHRGPLAIHASRLPTGVDSFWKRAAKEASFTPRPSQRAALDEFLALFEGCVAAATAAGIVTPEVTIRDLCGMTGHVVGIANVVGCVIPPDKTRDYAGPIYEGPVVRMGTASRYTVRLLTENERRWWMGGFALVLDDVVELETPIPCKGALGLWPLPPHVEEQLRRAA